MNIRVGNGYDTHPLVKGRPFILGGVNIPSDFGIKGH
jgi:2-C-methyl-D-erythritol 2,4-cyclodiphosphate synthase